MKIHNIVRKRHPFTTNWQKERIHWKAKNSKCINSHSATRQHVTSKHRTSKNKLIYAQTYAGKFIHWMSEKIVMQKKIITSKVQINLQENERQAFTPKVTLGRPIP